MTTQKLTESLFIIVFLFAVTSGLLIYSDSHRMSLSTGTANSGPNLRISQDTAVPLGEVIRFNRLIITSFDDRDIRIEKLFVNNKEIPMTNESLIHLGQQLIYFTGLDMIVAVKIVTDQGTSDFRFN